MSLLWTKTVQEQAREQAVKVCWLLDDEKDLEDLVTWIEQGDKDFGLSVGELVDLWIDYSENKKALDYL